MNRFYQWAWFLGIVCLWACQQGDSSPKGINGRIVHAHLSGDILFLYSVKTVEDIALGRGYDAWETVMYEEAYVTGIRLRDTSATPLYHLPTACSQQTCGSHYMDKMLAVGNGYAALGCSCKGNFSIIDLQTGKEVMDTEKAIQRYAALSSGIAKWQNGQDGTALLITANDGRKFQLSLHDLQLAKHSLSDSDCILWDINQTVSWAEMEDQRYYFDMNTDDYQSFLVVRSMHSGTSQSRLYRTGEAWLCPDFLAHPVLCGKAVQHEGHLFVVHASKWNDALAKDLLTMVDAKGNRIFTKPLSDYGCQDMDYCWFFPSGSYLYIVTAQDVALVQLSNGALLRKLPHRAWKF